MSINKGFRFLKHFVQVVTGLVIALVVAIGILVVSGLVTTREPKHLAKLMDRVLNTSLLVLALSESFRALKMIRTGYLLGLKIFPPARRPRHTFYMHQGPHPPEEGTNPLSQEKAWVQEKFRWVDTQQLDEHDYCPFGIFPRHFRSPLSLFSLGLIQLTGIVSQAFLCHISFHSPRAYSYANGFLTLFLASTLCHAFTYASTILLNHYHSHLVELRSAKFTLPQFRNYRYFSHITKKTAQPIPAFLRK